MRSAVAELAAGAIVSEIQGRKVLWTVDDLYDDSTLAQPFARGPALIEKGRVHTPSDNS